MDRRKFLALSGAATIGTTANLLPSTAIAAPLDTSINAKDFGLKPYITDDQSQILQSAIDQAAQQKLPLFIPGGSYLVREITLPEGAHISGIAGQTILVQIDNSPIFQASEIENTTLEGIIFEGTLPNDPQSSLVRASAITNFSMQHCQFFNSQGSGLELYRVSGQITANKFYNLGQSAIFSVNGKNLKIIQNSIYNIDNNGILIWQNDKADDGSIVSQNHIYGIKSADGGNGQNGNGINVFKANNVIMSDNRIDDCEYSAIRINDGNNCQIINNNCTNIGEVALYAEFGFNGVIINNNIVDTAGAGISIANLDQNGHLAVCKGNLLRNLTLRPTATSNDDARAYGIAAEADALIEGNVIENATNFGIGGGYGEFMRNVSVINNMIKDCGHAITASVVQGAGKMTISNNSIHNPTKASIVGFAWDKVVTDDLIDENQKFDEGSAENLNISNNVLT